MDLINKNDISSLFDEDEEEINFIPEEDNDKEIKKEEAINYFDDEKLEDKKEKENNDNQNQNNYNQLLKTLEIDLDNTKKYSEDDIISLIKNDIETKINKGIDEKTKRVSNALEKGISIEQIKDYEETIDFLHKIKETDLISEDDETDDLRKKLIYQSLINDGKNNKEAIFLLKEIIEKGDDIKEAKKALSSNKIFFSKKYKELIDKEEEEEKEKENKKEEERKEIESKILKDSFIEGLDITNEIRIKALDNLTNAKYYHDGKYISALQKYQINNPIDYLKNITILFTLTDGFKKIDLDNLFNKKVNKKIKDVENLINTPSNQLERLELVNSYNNKNSKFKFGK